MRPVESRWASVALLVLLALLWATWPAAPLAWAGVLALVAVGLLALQDRRRAALLALGAAALATALLPGDLFAWRPWASAALLVATLATLLAPDLTPRPPRLGLLLVAASLAGFLALLRVWAPTRDALGTRSGAGVAVASLAAAGLALVIVLASGDEDEAPDARA